MFFADNNLAGFWPSLFGFAGTAVAVLVTALCQILKGQRDTAREHAVELARSVKEKEQVVIFWTGKYESFVALMSAEKDKLMREHMSACVEIADLKAELNKKQAEESKP